MSRGPGRIERAIAEAFERNPQATFSVAELAPYAFPGLNSLSRKHRVSIIRAAENVAWRLYWRGEHERRRHGEIIYSNLLDPRSLRLGMLRRDFCCNRDDLATVHRVLEEDASELVPRGVWWLHTQIHRANIEGDETTSLAFREELERRVKRNMAERVWREKYASLPIDHEGRDNDEKFITTA
jgi:hypothetical protein